MSLGMVDICGLSVTRMILGGNPFSGFSHQTPARDDQMRHYYTTSRIKEALRLAEQAGINTHIGRADHHITRCLMEYWDEGGTIQWIAQTCPELGDIARGIDNAVTGGAKGCFLHGGMMDNRLANEDLDDIVGAIEKIKAAGLAAGIAGHNPKVFEWAQQHLDVDFYMCSYYNAAHRDEKAQYESGMEEWFDGADRQIMVELIQALSKPVIHYKVMAAGRNDPKEALGFAARHMRPQDVVCVGVYLKENANSIEQNVRLLEEALR